jgi:hypothetical protein
LPMTSGTIKPYRCGSRLRCDLDEPMSFPILIENVISGECVYAIYVAYRRNNKRLGFAVVGKI